MNYKPGSFFLTSISGSAGFLIGLGQALAGAPSRFSHAGIVTSETGDVVEAEPGGARIGNLSEYAGHALLVSDGPVQQWLKSETKPGGETGVFATYPKWLEDGARSRVVREAKALIGTPYSALDYAALAALHLHLPSKWIRQRVESSGHMICSQLTDAVYERAGIHLFDDGRLPGDVLPSDLAALAEDWAAKQ